MERSENVDEYYKANEQIAIKWFAAFNEQNLENLLELYDENARHFSPKLKLRHPEQTALLWANLLCVHGSRTLLKGYPNYIIK